MMMTTALSRLAARSSRLAAEKTETVPPQKQVCE